MSTVAIMQPSYLPWCGYFNMIDQADLFILYDTVQFSRKSWQQRNQIRGRDGSHIWLTIPTLSPHKQPLNHMLIADSGWKTKHWRTISNAYSHAPHWHALEQTLQPIYEGGWERLADFTQALIRALTKHIGISTPITRASAIPNQRQGREERIEDIIRHTGAHTFLEPMGATFLKGHTHIGGALIEWHNYTPHPYSQGTQPWQSHLAAIDLLAWHGPNALTIIRQGYDSCT